MPADLYIENSLSSTVNLFNNNFDQSAKGTYIKNPFPIDPSNLDNEDPLFVDPVNDDFHLSENSPCIDAGTSLNAPKYDFEADARPHDSGFDIGADEYVAPGQFADIPSNYWAEDAIYKIYEAGITTGCSKDPMMYCPKRTVNRAQMAVFLLRSKYDSNYKPPKAKGIFTDVPVTYWAADWIEQLYKEGITTGCSTIPLKYCPLRAVNRAQMAVFLSRTFGL